MDGLGQIPNNYTSGTNEFNINEKSKDILEENNLGNLHTYIPSNSTDSNEDEVKDLSTRSFSSRSSRPTPPSPVTSRTAPSQSSPETTSTPPSQSSPETASTPPSRWVKTINWAKEQVVSYLETPSDENLITATRAFNRLKNPPSDVTQKETVIDYMTFVSSTASIGRLGTEILGFPLISGALGHIATGVGGLSTAVGLVSPDPNFQNLKKETEQLINNSFNQTLDLVTNLKKNNSEKPDTNSKYDSIQELLKTKKDEYLEKSTSATSTEEIATVLEDLLDTMNQITDTYQITSSNRALIPPLLEKCNHTAARSRATFQQAETSVSDAIRDVNSSLERLNSKQDSEKNISSRAIETYKNIRIKLLSQKNDLDDLLNQITDKSSDEAERLKTAETIDKYVNSTTYRMFHEQVRDVLSL